MNQLNKLGVTVGKDYKAEIVFDSLFDDFYKVKTICQLTIFRPIGVNLKITRKVITT